MSAFVCLSVYVQDYSKTSAWIWMKCCVSTDVGTWTNWLTFEPDPDHSPDAEIGLLSPIAYALQRGILLRRENPHWERVAAATRGFESYALQRGILLRRESLTYWYWGPVEAATRGFEASNSTPGFDFDHITAVDMSFCTSLRHFIQIGPPSTVKKITSCRFSRWRRSRLPWILGVQ